MSTHLLYKKVYIDTNYMTPDSKSTSDFSIELPQTMYFPNDSTVFYIDDICICHSWYTVETNFNDKLYIWIQSANDTSSNILSLDPGNYTGSTLSATIYEKLPKTIGTLSISWEVTYIGKTNNIKISTTTDTVRFHILTPNDLKKKLNGVFSVSYDITNTNDCNELIGNIENDFTEYSKTKPFISQAINLQPIRNIYLHSSSLGNLNNIGPDGSQTVIKKIPVTADYNSFIFDSTVLFNDYNSCSGQTLKKLDFQLKTAQGKLVPLHNIHVSLSIVFSRASPDG